jgi:hypothetical protein
VNEREVARELLRELVQGALAGGNGQHAPETGAPQVPAPPVAAVLRPSTWSRPAAPGEAIGSGEPAGASAAPSTDPGAEQVTIDSDADLDRFVRALADRLEDPAQRDAIRAGRLRFALRREDGRRTSRSSPYTVQSGTFDAAASGGVMRIERGALTERTVEKAAKAGARLVLARAAVATPLAREKARALGIEIERE